MKFKNKIIVVCLCASVFAGGCSQGGQNTTKSKNSEGTASSKESTERTSQDNEASKDIFAMDTYMTVKAYGSTDCLTNPLILSILVDTFISKISLPMQPVPEIGSISGA